MASFLDRFIDRDKAKDLTITNPREVFNNILKQTSGSALTRNIKFDIFYQIITFKGVAGGVGTSTIVANTAIALAELGMNVCVIDTSILYPVQDLLLKTNYDDIAEKDRIDWFDMPFTKKSPLHVSRLSNKISVLSFYGKNRGITDILSTNDNEALVEMALTELHNKFDLILIDSCNELTNINTASLQLSQQVIQVWNDSPIVVNNIDSFITNQVTLACPLDKMRYVIYSKYSEDVMGTLDGILEQYRLRKLSEIPLSNEVYNVACIGKPLWQYTSLDPGVARFTDEIIKIVLHILNIKLEENKVGKFTANDIANGKVEGTVHNKLFKKAENIPPVVTTIEQADASLQNWGSQPPSSQDDLFTGGGFAPQQPQGNGFIQPLQNNGFIQPQNNGFVGGIQLTPEQLQSIQNGQIK